MSILPPFPNAFCWRVLIVFGLVDIVLGIGLGFTINPRPFPAMAFIIVMMALAHYHTVPNPRPIVAGAEGLLAFVSANGLVFGPLCYFSAGLGLPLVDKYLAALDPLLSFDWRWLLHVTAGNSVLSSAFLAIYGYMSLQLFTVLIALCVTRQVPRLSLFITAITIATPVCIGLAALFPAVGAYPYWGETPPGYLEDTQCCVGYLHDLLALRDGSLREIDLTQTKGIVTFPSFHTIVALLCGWALIGMRWIGIPFATLSGLIIFATLPIGGHHLADLFGGAAVAWASLRVARGVEAGSPISASAARQEIALTPGIVWEPSR